MDSLFDFMEKVNHRPKPFEVYTADALWTDEHTAKQMLSFHLDEDVDLSSRNARFIDRSVEWIYSKFGVGPGTTIADFGCGPGLYASRLARNGAQVTGIDFSASSIEYAQTAAAKEGLSIDYICENYLTYESERQFDLILMIFCDLCALSPAQRAVLLAKYRSLLAPGGSVLLDVHSLSCYAGFSETMMFEKNLLNGFWSANDYYGFLTRFKYDSDMITLDKYTIVEPSRIRTVYNWLQFFSPDSLRKEMDQAGLTVREMFGDVAGADYNEKNNDFAVVATARS